MSNFSFDRFKELASINEPHCISIYIPTHRAGMEVNEKIDQKNLKNKVQKLTHELSDYYLKSREIEYLLEPIKQLLEDSGFWSQQLEGLVIFRNDDIFAYYSVPVSFQDFVYISDHFYVKPLLPYLNDDAKFYLLALSLSDVKLYEGLPHQIHEVQVNGLVPETFNEVVGYDYKEKNLQFRTGHTGSENAVYHGHGSGKEEDKLEIQKYFRAINDGLMKVLQNRRRPLIVAAVDYLVPIYREVNEYQNLYTGFIAGNPEHEDPKKLHEKARNLLGNKFYDNLSGFTENFEQALSLQKASINEDEVISAAFNGKIDTLFVTDNEVMWGMYDKIQDQVIRRDELPQYKACLLNFAAVQTILHGGTVHILEADKMPYSHSKLNAIYRY